MEGISLPPEIKKTLKIIANLFKENDIQWYLRGSAGLVLQGFSISVGDIDIETDEPNGYKIHKCLEDYSVIPFGPSRTGIFSDIYGLYRIKKVKIDLIHDFRIDRPPYHYHSVIDNKFRQHVTVHFVENVKIKVIPLEEVICGKLAKGHLERCRTIMEQSVFHRLIDLKYLQFRVACTGLDQHGAELLTSYTPLKWEARKKAD